MYGVKFDLKVDVGVMIFSLFLVSRVLLDGFFFFVDIIRDLG